MQETRREFLKKVAKASAGVGAVVTAVTAANAVPVSKISNSKGKHSEVLYWKSEAWDKFYKVAY
ncbi:twin-arginine translocation signal domain-containing protein [Campylobacter sp. RM12327]|uniref:twin-arginine translocation signal domain-containing protein n=1 Tax=Campylobacter sputorum TaxID=206 RepID=UPI000B779351|nr:MULTISPECIES: twin-arginine translocation signal domain-containing protein [Campylobacter]ASM39192.1 putative formate dehydrogenase-associated protein [Campylobacter sputorum bv. paraureolyticus LMG 11764]MBF6670147.1 twin-arginine translocation signal domain-containing protein [Campylobacter sp. RM12327]MDY6121456.1 twin-arginine translocation signal domain-containing protein [Campylobacter sputorum]